MPDALAEQIEVYQRLLPEIKRRDGPVWVLIAGGQLINTFKKFADASQYANDRLPDQQVLIRHTDRKAEFVPLIIVGTED